MSRTHTPTASALALTALAACGLDAAPEPTAALDAELGAGAARLVQAGAGLIPLGVTADHHAIYQDAGAVYATSLGPCPERTQLAALAPGDVPFVKISGAVAFVWPRAQAATSPLVAWSRRGGARALAAASLVLPTATEADADGDRAVFLANVDDGATGDLQAASLTGVGRQTVWGKGEIAFRKLS